MLLRLARGKVVLRSRVLCEVLCESLVRLNIVRAGLVRPASRHRDPACLRSLVNRGFGEGRRPSPVNIIQTDLQIHRCLAGRPPFNVERHHEGRCFKKKCRHEGRCFKKMQAWCQTTLKGRAGQAPSWDLHVCLNNIDRGSWSDFVNQMQRFE